MQNIQLIFNKETMTVLILTDLVKDTSSNSEGERLYIMLDQSISVNKEVTLSVGPEVAMSSSFLNSSIGKLIDFYGLVKFKALFKFQGSSNQFQRLVSYISRYSVAHHGKLN